MIESNYINSRELFARIADLLGSRPEDRNRIMHETLVTLCSAVLKNKGQAFGNLLTQVAELCRMLNISKADTRDIQNMRRHSNSKEPTDDKQFVYDCRALAILVSAATGDAIPSSIVGRIPTIGRSTLQKKWTPRLDYMRCIVSEEPSPGGDTISVNADDDNDDGTLHVCLRTGTTDHTYLLRMAHKGTQFNLLDSTTDDKGRLCPSIIVLEPDFLMDISTLAACFEDFGHHPLIYTLNHMKPRPNTQAILLGNFAGRALDDIINNPHYDFVRTMRSNFCDKAMEYATCPDFNAAQFKKDANLQVDNIQKAVTKLFEDTPRDKALLEPSFVCEKLGIQGRVDLMTTDKRLLVEQKAGKNFYIERNRRNRHGSLYLEKHFVQALLYYGVLRYNFNLKGTDVVINLLYSKFPPEQGLVMAKDLFKLLVEAIKLRNRIVAGEYFMAREGFQKVIGNITPNVLNTEHDDSFFYNNYLKPQIERVSAPLHSMPPLEHAYFCRMMTFVLREQLYSKTGAQEGVGNSAADLWNMPLKEKVETGNIFMGLTIEKKEKENPDGGFDTITLRVPEQCDDFLPNFRQGDMVYLYAYREGETPDVRTAILFKGTLAEMHTTHIVVHLNDGQQNPHVFGDEQPSTTHHGQRPKAATRYAVEHSGSDAGTGSAVRSLHEFITADESRRSVLLAQRSPQCDATRTLSRSYDPLLDPLLLRAKQASDYFLLVGPPGTGKTSRALRFIVEEELANEKGQVLLMSYTNRAVDEICSMLCDAGISFMRIGNEYSCDTRFRPYLLSHAVDSTPRLDDITQKVKATRVVVGTTATLMARPFIFALKHFTLAVVDEAGQITEPNIIGLLAAHNHEQPQRQVIGRFILIGDYKQLPAVVQQSEQESAVDDPLLRAIGITNCRDSLFERLIRNERAHGREQYMGILQRQGRMHPDIAEFANKMFYFNEQLQPVPCKHQIAYSLGYDAPSDDHTDDVLKSRRMVFIPSRQCHEKGMSDKVNTHEAHIVADMLRRIRRFYGERFCAATTVGVIVPYRNQIAMIRKEMSRMHLEGLDDVSIDTVERFQGSQRDVIIYSFTVHSQWQMEFLTANCFDEDGRTIDRKLNVAITRARCQMIMTGNPQVLGNDPIFMQLMEFVKAHGGYLEQQ